MKVRDLQRSCEYRESVKKWGLQCRRRVFIAAHIASEIETALNPVKYTPTSTTTNNPLYVIDREIEKKQKEHEDLKSWIYERALIRNELNNIGFNESWYRNKTNKTECETQAHNRMKVNKNQKEIKDRSEKARVVNPTIVVNKPRVSKEHIAMLPYLETPLPIALAIIADYLHDKRLRLVDLYRNIDKNQDWLMTRDELKKSLQTTHIPLSDGNLDELILKLDIDSDDKLTYKELAMGIDTYRSDKRWQRLKEMYDDLVEEDKEEKRKKKSAATVPIGLLSLPRMEARYHSLDLLTPRHSRERRIRSQQEKQCVRRKMVSKSIPSLITTLSGPQRQRKLTCLKRLNEECERCTDMLQAYGIIVFKNDIKNVIEGSAKNALLPPEDNPVNLCHAYLSSDRGILPHNHPICQEHRRRQKKKLNKLSPTKLAMNDASLPVREGETALPRVALLDVRDRKYRARQERRQRECASPTPCWPQHLLDKMHLCMDDNAGSFDRKSVLFQKVINQ